MNLLFFYIFLNIVFGFLIIVAMVNIVMNEVKVHWKAYSILHIWDAASRGAAIL